MGNESRFQEKQQSRRKRGVVNIGLSLVLLTVSMVSYQLFFTNQTKGKERLEEKKVDQLASKEAKKNKLEEQKTKQSEEEASKEQLNKEVEKQTLTEQQNQEKESPNIPEKEKQSNENQMKKQEEQQNTKMEKQKVNEEGTTKNQTEQNNQWKPIGTEQGTKPAMQFKEGTTDWNEMKKAISYAVDVPESQLIYDFIGNNGTNKAYSNVRDKQSNKKYKVYIDWVENKGWKPVSVQVVK
ncbi:DUF1510 family protein [Bacillus cereus]|uniref:YrrS family protein n=1 Tax=Bacillus cereus TaxID=1396 RepID=UPI00356C94A1